MTAGNDERIFSAVIFPRNSRSFALVKVLAVRKPREGTLQETCGRCSQQLQPDRRGGQHSFDGKTKRRRCGRFLHLQWNLRAVKFAVEFYSKVEYTMGEGS